MNKKSVKKNIAIITGASSGIGRDFVMQIPKAFKGLDEIWVIARRKERLIKLQKECKVLIRVLPLDLLKEEDVKSFHELLKLENPHICILVNSSGFGKRGYFKDMTYQDVTQMIELNCRGLTAITCLCIPYLKKGGYIINMASSAGFIPQPKFAVYGATKSFVLSLSRALDKELEDRNVSVTAVCPGPVNTEFFCISDKYSGLKPYKRAFLADPKAVVALAIRDSKKRKEVSVYGGLIKGFYLISKLMPHKILIALADRL